MQMPLLGVPTWQCGTDATFQQVLSVGIKDRER
jgi:hypothetical protein